MRRLAFAALVLAGCYDWDALSSTLDFSGQYTVQVTNGQNGCGLANWTPGTVSNAIPLTITQTGNQVVATVGGGVGVLLDFFCGAKELVGTANRGMMDVSLRCPKETMQMTCGFHYLAHAQATLNGNGITGTIDYTTQITTDTADCAPLRNCHNSQSFVGSRP